MLAELRSPPPIPTRNNSSSGTTLTAAGATFEWSAGYGVTNYQLLVGVNGPVTASIYNSGVITARSASVTAIPAYGVTVYARLLSENGGVWQSHDYTYIEK
jgi:hypothetical protein